MSGLRVQRRMCATCIYRKDSSLDIVKLENDVRERVRGQLTNFFKGHRICHHSKDAVCAGFWARHKDHFTLGQIAQRFKMVVKVDDDTG